ncbi:hypothetical protein CA13_66480 [Planctomycetes bacterium CA13]|uniref:Uncharacterized protein n=1 Tax=Novipirellula herctigrandis TaxID=2527986 RepID=A0A5C5ZDF0_9BACT|nr:hypothetical protein CA13_66480 [Planctomycetes bacterium CA13]
MSLLTPEDRNDLNFDRIGPVLETLVDSDRLTSDERRAVELCARAAADLISLEHQERMREYYARQDVSQRSADTIAAWLESNPNAEPGTVVAVSCRMHVASFDRSGRLQLTPFLD